MRSIIRTALLTGVSLACLAFAAQGGPVTATRVGNDYHLENGLVRLVMQAQPGGFVEKVYARSRSGWNLVLEGAGPKGATLRFLHDLKADLPLYQMVTIAPLPSGAALDLLATAGGHPIRVRVEALPDRPLLRYRVRLEIKGTALLEALENEYRFLPGRTASSLFPLELGWCPGQRLKPGFVLADQAFHSPLAIMHRDGSFAALIPDVEQIPLRRDFKTAMRYVAGKNAALAGPRFSYGLMDYALNGHVFFQHHPIMAYRVNNRLLGFGYYLAVRQDISADDGLELASRTLWSLNGAPRSNASTWPQYAPFHRCARAAYDWAFRSPYRHVVWHEFVFGGLKCGGTDMYVTYDRQRKGAVTHDPVNDGIWFHSWFNNLRSAYGMYLMGVSLQDPDLIRRANLIKNLALSAPVDRGLFPAVFEQVSTGEVYGKWRGPTPFIPDRKRPHDFHYHLPDAAWTGYWMIRWYQTLHGDPRLAVRARALADRLVALQLPSGAVPSWVAKGSFKPAPELKESAATAATALFLVRTHAVLKNPAYLAAARRALAYLEREVIPSSKWWDFECLVSGVGPLSLVRDSDTGLHDANTMSMTWAAMGFAEMYEVTREAKFLKLGRRVVNELSLYQHLHDKPWHFGIPSFGGFTAQNRDAEQNDARQALAGPVFLDYYRLTGREDYFHRGVAALRASFTNMYLPENRPVWVMLNLLFPWFGPDDHGFTEENAFHTGDPGFPFVMRASNFNWGPGSAAAGAAEAELRYGGIYVDLTRSLAFGLDGCLARLTRTAPGEVRLTVTETLGTSRSIRLVVEGVPAGKNLWFAAAGRLIAHARAGRQRVPVGAGIGALMVPIAARQTATYVLTVR